MAVKKHSNLNLFHRGSHLSAYGYMGCTRKKAADGSVYTVFRVWAPGASRVFVTGMFDRGEKIEMALADDRGIWHVFVDSDLFGGAHKYKYLIVRGEYTFTRPDPYALRADCLNEKYSYVYSLPDFIWTDDKWIGERRAVQRDPAPMMIYEFDPGTFYRGRNAEFLTYKQTADMLAPYIAKTGFTHIRFPIYSAADGSGTFGKSFFAPDSRLGDPSDLMYLINKFHNYSVSVILTLDFCSFSDQDESLCDYDGGALYEYRKKTGSDSLRYFDFSKPEVRSYLLSYAAFFIREYHADGICLDCRRFFGNDAPEIFRQRDMINFTKQAVQILKGQFPDVLIVSDGIPSKYAVTKPVITGGAGFDLKMLGGWSGGMRTIYNNGGYLHDLLYRGFADRSVMSVSPVPEINLFDESPQKDILLFYREFLLLTVCIPGKKSVFSGCEFGDFYGRSKTELLNWYKASAKENADTLLYTSDLIHFYKDTAELWEIDESWDGLKPLAYDNGFTAFARYAANGSFVVCVFNFTPNRLNDVTFGVPMPGFYSEIFTSNPEESHSLPMRAKKSECGGFENSLTADIGPYSGVILKSESLIRTNKRK